MFIAKFLQLVCSSSQWQSSQIYQTARLRRLKQPSQAQHPSSPSHPLQSQPHSILPLTLQSIMLLLSCCLLGICKLGTLRLPPPPRQLPEF
jgi:hypothetical protein